MLFFVVTQNLSAILNQPLRTNFLYGFDDTLSRNVNHLMLANDLILIKKASCQSARNVIFCLNLYANISRQNPNLLKSAIYFPSWIASILGIKIG